MTDADEHARWTTYFSGSVQGVGFRYTTERVAQGFNVTGFVRNLSDGRVGMVAEGASAEVERFLVAVEGAMGRYIRDRQVSRSPGTGEFDGFGIRY
jgi:acylphosphatase